MSYFFVLIFALYGFVSNALKITPEKDFCSALDKLQPAKFECNDSSSAYNKETVDGLVEWLKKKEEELGSFLTRKDKSSSTQDSIKSFTCSDTKTLTKCFEELEDLLKSNQLESHVKLLPEAKSIFKINRGDEIFSFERANEEVNRGDISFSFERADVEGTQLSESKIQYSGSLECIKSIHERLQEKEKEMNGVWKDFLDHMKEYNTIADACTAKLNTMPCDDDVTPATLGQKQTLSLSSSQMTPYETFLQSLTTYLETLEEQKELNVKKSRTFILKDDEGYAPSRLMYDHLKKVNESLIEKEKGIRSECEAAMGEQVRAARVVLLAARASSNIKTHSELYCENIFIPYKSYINDPSMASTLPDSTAQIDFLPEDEIKPGTNAGESGEHSITDLVLLRKYYSIEPTICQMLGNLTTILGQYYESSKQLSGNELLLHRQISALRADCTTIEAKQIKEEINVDKPIYKCVDKHKKLMAAEDSIYYSSVSSFYKDQEKFFNRITNVILPGYQEELFRNALVYHATQIINKHYNAIEAVGQFVKPTKSPSPIMELASPIASETKNNSKDKSLTIAGIDNIRKADIHLLRVDFIESLETILLGANKCTAYNNLLVSEEFHTKRNNVMQSFKQAQLVMKESFAMDLIQKDEYSMIGLLQRDIFKVQIQDGSESQVILTAALDLELVNKGGVAENKKDDMGKHTTLVTRINKAFAKHLEENAEKRMDRIKERAKKEKEKMNKSKRGIDDEQRSQSGDAKNISDFLSTNGAQGLSLQQGTFKSNNPIAHNFWNARFVKYKKVPFSFCKNELTFPITPIRDSIIYVPPPKEEIKEEVKPDTSAAFVVDDKFIGGAIPFYNSGKFITPKEIKDKKGFGYKEILGKLYWISDKKNGYFSTLSSQLPVIVYTYCTGKLFMRFATKKVGYQPKDGNQSSQRSVSMLQFGAIGQKKNKTAGFRQSNSPFTNASPSSLTGSHLSISNKEDASGVEATNIAPGRKFVKYVGDNMIFAATVIQHAHIGMLLCRALRIFEAYIDKLEKKQKENEKKKDKDKHKKTQKAEFKFEVPNNNYLTKGVMYWESHGFCACIFRKLKYTFYASVFGEEAASVVSGKTAIDFAAYLTAFFGSFRNAEEKQQFIDNISSENLAYFQSFRATPELGELLSRFKQLSGHALIGLLKEERLRRNGRVGEDELDMEWLAKIPEEEIQEEKETINSVAKSNVQTNQNNTPKNTLVSNPPDIIKLDTPAQRKGVSNRVTSIPRTAVARQNPLAQQKVSNQGTQITRTAVVKQNSPVAQDIARQGTPRTDAKQNPSKQKGSIGTTKTATNRK